jgi:hypothetical protein
MLVEHAPVASCSVTLRVKLVNRSGSLGRLTTAIGRAGGDIGAIDIVNVAVFAAMCQVEVVRATGCRRLSLG